VEEDCLAADDHVRDPGTIKSPGKPTEEFLKHVRSGSGKLNVGFNPEENVMLPKTSEHCGPHRKEIEYPVFLLEREVVPSTGPFLERREICRISNHIAI